MTPGRILVGIWCNAGLATLTIGVVIPFSSSPVPTRLQTLPDKVLPSSLVSRQTTPILREMGAKSTWPGRTVKLAPHHPP